MRKARRCRKEERNIKKKSRRLQKCDTNNTCKKKLLLILIRLCTRRQKINGELSQTLKKNVIVQFSVTVSNFLQLGDSKSICDSTYRKYFGRLDFELQGCKVKVSQNIVPKSLLRFHIYLFWNLQHFIFKLLEGFVEKQCVHVKLDL